MNCLNWELSVQSIARDKRCKMDNYENAKKKAIQLLEKYKFNVSFLDEYKKSKKGDYIVCDEVIDILSGSNGEEEILKYLKCYNLKDLSRAGDAGLFETCITWDESGM